MITIMKQHKGEKKVFTRGLTWSRQLRQAKAFTSAFDALQYARIYEMGPVEVAELPDGFHKTIPRLGIAELKSL